ncbi:hypothetical protein G6F35_005565 [Rhizopus arrhizus]|nr:hypothetical protein G6F35_005565 [Rhizopus arrhizus]
MMLTSTLLPSVFLGLLLALASFPSFTNATAMTYNVAANEKACFYVMTDKPSKKIGFYFAVQEGGSFDIDYEVTGPRDNVILSGESEKQADYVFTANDVGEKRSAS